MSSKPNNVFVYGSLMEGFELHAYLSDSTLIGCGVVRGTLVALDGYPGLLDGSDAVQGEVYRLNEPEKALKVIDRVERFDESDPSGSLFLRVVRPVTLSDGAALNAWMYLLNRHPSNYQAVPNGDWRAFVSTTHKLRT
jgi:gamma-glutamylcyclotransferase (GGCT)/AIG2-like uncharacterized protein YtfP